MSSSKVMGTTTCWKARLKILDPEKVGGLKENPSLQVVDSQLPASYMSSEGKMPSEVAGIKVKGITNG
jgi:hypothetical protein